MRRDQSIFFFFICKSQISHESWGEVCPAAATVTPHAIAMPIIASRTTSFCTAFLCHSLVVVVPPPPSATPLDPYLTLSRPTQTIGRPSSSRRLSFSCILSQTLFSVDSTHLKTVNCSISLAAAIQLLIPEPLQITSNIPDNCFRSKSQTH